MTAFFTSVALAALAGIGFIAVRHPKVYKDVVFDKLYLVAFVVLIAMISWGASAAITLQVLAPYITPDKLAEAKEAAASVTIPNEYALLFSFGFFGYLLVLSWLAGHIDKDQRTMPSKGPDES